MATYTTTSTLSVLSKLCPTELDLQSREFGSSGILFNSNIIGTTELTKFPLTFIAGSNLPMTVKNLNSPTILDLQSRDFIGTGIGLLPKVSTTTLVKFPLTFISGINLPMTVQNLNSPTILDLQNRDFIGVGIPSITSTKSRGATLKQISGIMIPPNICL